MKRKNFLLHFLLFVMIAIILLLQLRHEDETCLQRMMLRWDVHSPAGQTCLYEADGIYYGFLPACADLDQLSVQTDIGYTLWLDDVLWQDTVLQTDREYTFSVKNLWGNTISEVPLILMKSENIPVLSILIDHGSMEDIKDLKEKSGRMTLTEADNDSIYAGDFEAMHIRGNYTATLPKTSYTLKFPQEVDLLGTGPFTTYRLVANTDDEARLRNKLVYETARALGLAHSPQSMFVDLYVDNVYYGLYMLTDKIDVHENRINITPLQEQTQALNFYHLNHYDPWSSEESGSLRRGFAIPTNPTDITGGYLLELESANQQSHDINTFVSEAGHCIAIKYPALCSAEQVNYLAEFYQQVEDSVADGTYPNYLDVESFAKFYLMEEFFGQHDRSSIFFYKDSDCVDPKLYAGPVWDFDWSFGFLGQNSGTYLSTPYRFYFHCGLFSQLRQDPAFRSAVEEIYQTELYPLLTEFLPAAFDYYEEQIAASHAMDKCRWYHIYPPRYGPFFDSFSESIESMKGWVSQRTDFFRELFAADWQTIRISFHADGESDPIDSYDLTPNSYFIPESVVPTRDGSVFSGWYTAEGQRLTADTLLTEDTAFYAAWESAPVSGLSGSEAIPEDAVPLPEEDSADSFEYTDPADYAVLLILAVLAVLVPCHMIRDILSSLRRSKKKRSPHDKRTKISP